MGRSSSFRIQRFSGTAALVLLGGAFFAISYALRVPWAWRLNFSLVYCVLCVVAMEICLDCGVIPSYHGIAGIFGTLPLDLKVLTRDLQEVYATPVSKPVPVGVREELRVQEHGRAHAFAVASDPDVMYRAFPLLGGSALLAQDVSELNELNRELAHRRMELQRQNELLAADYDLKTHLADQEAETLLVQDVDQALARALKGMYDLLSSLPPLTDEASSHERYRMLQRAKMLVAYCKRKGSLTLAQHGESGFDRDRIQLIANELASDLRTIDIDCASIIAIRRPLHASTVSALYDCVYDFAFFCLHHRPSGAYVSRATMIDAVSSCAPRFFPTMMQIFSQTPAAQELESALQGRNVAYRLEGEPGQLRMIVLMPRAGEVTMQISLILPQIVALDVVFALAACLQTIHVPLISSRRSSYNRKVICAYEASLVLHLMISALILFASSGSYLVAPLDVCARGNGRSAVAQCRDLCLRRGAYGALSSSSHAGRAAAHCRRDTAGGACHGLGVDRCPYRRGSVFPVPLHCGALDGRP